MDGVAVSSAINLADDPAERIRQFLNQLESSTEKFQPVNVNH
jgi:thiamine monophosphate synthase